VDAVVEALIVAGVRVLRVSASRLILNPLGRTLNAEEMLKLENQHESRHVSCFDLRYAGCPARPSFAHPIQNRLTSRE
jgi:hypothetical protein